MWTCRVCGESLPSGKILEHSRLFHSELYEPVEKWPDGEPVVYEDADEFFL